MDDGFGIMVVSGCSTYVTEPVDVVLVVTGRVLYICSGWAAACMYGVVVVVCCGGHHLYMIVLMVVVEYTTRVVTLCACISYCVEWM